MTDLYTKPVHEVIYEDLEAFAHTMPPPAEGERLDFKEPLDQRVVETVVGMANREGGLILVGVGEQKGTKFMRWPPPGLEHRSSVDTLTSLCHAKIRPLHSPRMHPVDMPGTKKHILVVRVDRRRHGALWHEDKGVLVRIGDQNRPADLETLRALLLGPARLTEAEQHYNQEVGWMKATGGRGEEPLLGAAVLYPEGAPAFGSAEKRALHSAVATHFDFASSAAVLESTSTTLQITSPERERGRIVARFRADGSASVRVTRRFTAIPWQWVVGEAYFALQCLRAPQVQTVYPVVKESQATLVCADWPEAGVSISDLMPGQPRPHGGPHRGYTVSGQHEMSSDTDLWGIVIDFARLVVADAGYLDFERHLASQDSREFFAWYLNPALNQLYHRATDSPPMR